MSFSQSNSVRALFKVFVRQKVTITENITIADSVSGIWSLDCSQLAKNPKNDVTIFRQDINIKFFWRYFVSLVNFSCWSKFYVNITTSSEIMAIFFFKGLTRNPEIGNTPFGVCPISRAWGELCLLNLARMSLIEVYWMMRNSRVTAFIVFELLRENHLWGDKIAQHPLAPPRLGLKVEEIF